MICHQIVRNGVICLFMLGSLVISVRAQNDDDAEAKERLKLMQRAVDSLDPDSAELKSKTALAAVPTPLLRYNDPTRGGVKVESANNFLLDAGVWRLGTEGRPTALATIEIYQAPDGSRLLSLEFLSLSDKKFSLKHKTENIRWDATASGLEMKDLAGAPKPAATASGRLTQMRHLARRFAARETYNKVTVECRLIAQPIDRYQSEEQKIADGAIFALANGTNPEFGILLETDGERWRYGVLRLSAAESTVTLDGQPVVSYERFNARGRTDGPYNSSSYRLKTEK